MDFSSKEICLFYNIYLFNNLFIYLWTYGYLLPTLGFSLILLHLVAQILQLWLPRVLLVGSYISLTYTYQCRGGFCCFSTASLLVITKCSRLILYLFCPSPTISYFFKELWSLLLKMILEIKIWGLDVLVAPEVTLLPGPFSW